MAWQVIQSECCNLRHLHSKQAWHLAEGRMYSSSQVAVADRHQQHAPSLGACAPMDSLRGRAGCIKGLRSVRLLALQWRCCNLRKQP